MGKKITDIKIYKDLIEEEDCNKIIDLIDYLKSNEELNYTSDKRYCCQNYNHELFFNMAKKYSEILIKDYFSFSQPIYVSDFIATKYEVGSYMKEHSDSGNEEYGETIVSAVFYLNKDFEGGQIYFKEVGALISPKYRSAVSFPGDYLHSVFPITSGVRYIYALSFTENENLNVLKKGKI